MSGSKRLVACWACFITCAVSWPALGGQTRALLIGIDYRGSLPGCEGDARSMGLTLVRQFGFSESNLHWLFGERATRGNIIEAFKQLARESSNDDLVVVFYSGHGSALPDDNADEEDGQDETICSCDVLEGTGPDNGQIRDDLIGQLLDQIPARQQIIILDSCHSGTGTRNLTRCAAEKCLQFSGKALPKTTRPGKQQYRELRRQGRAVLIAGCAASETSAVIKVPADSRQFSASALTFFMNQGLRGGADADANSKVTYREMAGYAQRGIDEYFQTRSVDEPVPAALRIGTLGKQAAQSVQLEADAPDSPVFGGLQSRPFYSLVKSASSDRVELDTGAIHGLKPGTVLVVLNANGQAVGRVRVAQVEAERAAAVAVSGSGNWSGLRAQIETSAIPIVTPATPEPSPPAAQAPRLLAVRMVARSRDATASLARVLATALSREPFLRMVEDDNAPVDVAVLVLAVTSASGVHADLALQRRSGQVTDPISAEAPTIDAAANSLLPTLLQRLSAVYAAAVLADLSNPQPGFALTMTSDRGSQRPEYRIGETFSVQIQCPKECYLTIVDVGTSGEVSIIYPPANAPPVRLTPGQPLRVPTKGAFKITGPPGMDRLKAVATLQPLGLHELVQTKGPQGRETLRSLSLALKASSSVKAPGDLSVRCNEWAEASLAIHILP